MKFFFLFSLFFVLAKSKPDIRKPFIRDIQIIKKSPSCRDCIHYIPSTDSYEFDSSLSRCQQFGQRDVITDKITYDYVDTVRYDESKCGQNGKYFELEKNIQLKIWKHKFISFFPILLVMLLYSFVYIYF